MSEIKSTLDLVMERTRHLSMSSEEREAQQREAFEKRLQGLLQQYLDEGQSVDRLLDRLAALEKEMNVADTRLAITAVLSRIDPDGDNARWLEVLARLAPEACHDLRAILDRHRKARSEHLKAAARDLRHRFAQRHGITGGAVVPNPMKSPACRKALDALGRETREAVDAVAGRLA